MSEDGIDKDRRRFLTTTATVIGGAGAVAAAIPFVSTLLPSERTKALGAPVRVDISDILPGDLKRVSWQGKAVLILRRDEEALNSLPGLDEKVSDPDSNDSEQPDYAKNQYRSVKPEYLIVQGWCTHLGCIPTYARKGEIAEIENWQGGFFCPCHGSRFDLAGRVFKGVPAPLNLIVPPHQYLSDSEVLIGDDSGAA
ncbi:MAG: ubiquinol-cytochrome c reductase iron-sulfur subunit [Gammaproteobacteria bacterium RIFCSPLOWO2_12_FULL_52_10]|nr:MAG: ubiquinol-cytochrome c reductase iron-sulfur subunit [Gammaproteobacteria bacterium RIFCSPLOWO2_12_FULL_52_10]